MKKEWKKYYNPKFSPVAKMIHVLYELDGCLCGGKCHIVTDDNNIRNSDLEFVIEECNNDIHAIDSELSRAICEAMLQMTIEQRIILFYSIESDSFIFENYTEDEYETYFKLVKTPVDIIKKCKEEDLFNIDD